MVAPAFDGSSGALLHFGTSEDPRISIGYKGPALKSEVDSQRELGIGPVGSETVVGLEFGLGPM